jgi:hypothetical protein
MKVNRKHDDFLWLHERFSENPDYAGCIVCAHLICGWG